MASKEPGPDNLLWGFIKEEVRKNRYVTNDDLRAGVRTVFTLPSHATDAETDEQTDMASH